MPCNETRTCLKNTFSIFTLLFSIYPVSAESNFSWNRIIESGVPGSPPLRQGDIGIWDSANNILLLFGGQSSQSGYTSQLWQYRNDGGWQELIPNGQSGSPMGRAYLSGAWDTQNGRLLIFGGRNPPVDKFNDLWSYTDDSGWELITAPKKAIARLVFAITPPTWIWTFSKLINFPGTISWCISPRIISGKTGVISRHIWPATMTFFLAFVFIIVFFFLETLLK